IGAVSREAAREDPGVGAGRLHRDVPEVPGDRVATWLAVLAAVIGVLVVGAIVQPFGPPTNDPDAAASVLYFDRLAHGHRLESFVPTTPKPLLTLLFGLTWILVNDWRSLVLETLAVYG